MKYSALGLILWTLIFQAHAHVYPDVAHQRRAPNIEESEHLLNFGPGCSASALTSTIMISAEHCSGFKAGHFEADPRYKFKVVKILEKSSHYENDIAIYKIKWDKNLVPNNLQYIKSIVKDKSELRFGTKDQTPLFTLGYPRDMQKKATYSWGFLKGEKIYPASRTIKIKEAAYLQFNAPTIHGNSGGPVLTEGFKLVGIVSAGDGIITDEVLNSPEFNSENPKYWNLAGAIYYYYPKSPILMKLFPKK